MLHILTLEAIKHILKIIEHKNEHSLSIKSRSLTVVLYYCIRVLLVQYCIRTRDVKTPKFFGPARPVAHFSGPARPGPARPVIKVFNLGPFGPVWASKNILSSMFYNKTTNYLVLTDLQRRRLDFSSRKEHTAKNYSTETLKNFLYKLAYTIFKIFK